MAGRQLFFYATQKDLREVLSKVEKQINIKYHKAGLFDVDDLKEFTSLANDINIGVAEYGDCILCSRYLIINKDFEFKIRDVPQRKGGIKYAVDQKLNSTSIVFRPAGSFQDANAIIQGELSTLHANKDSLEIFDNIAQNLKSDFVKIKGILVGKEAIELHRNGWRLTQDINAPKEYDLQTSNL